jgi:hypothetical protein
LGRRKIDVKRLLRNVGYVHFLKAELEAWSVQDHTGIRLGGATERCEVRDFTFVVGPDLEIVERGCPEPGQRCGVPTVNDQLLHPRPSDILAGLQPIGHRRRDLPQLPGRRPLGAAGVSVVDGVGGIGAHRLVPCALDDEHTRSV